MPNRGRAIAVYGLTLVGAVGAYLVVRSLGLHASAPAVPPGSPTFDGSMGRHLDPLLQVLFALFAVTAVARLFGRICAHFGQPRVIGEILAGIALGPSLLGRIAPAVAQLILPSTVAPYLQVISQLGVVLYMFVVGIELEPGHLRNRGRVAVAISHASIVAPFLLGSMLALALYPRLSTSDVPFTAFSLFMGVSMSVTAFPVLARILTDRDMHRSQIGVIALTCAAVDDVTAWCLLAIVVGVARSQATNGLLTIGLSAVYLLAVIFVLRPVATALVRRVEARGTPGQGDLGAALLLMLASALATNAIGIHAVFGAFVSGALIPPRSRLGRGLVDQVGDLVIVLFLPAFFAYTGMRTQIGLVSGAAQWGLCAVIILVACTGKFGGSAMAARACGMPWRDATALGVLMNTRGLMELIVLDIGLELRVLSPALFAMLVLMALVTTFATTPVLNWLKAREER